jgi:penicillin-binding protein 2
LWSLQIDRHEEFVNKVPESKKLRARIPGVRGDIRDRNGVVLATNKATFEVRVNLAEVLQEYKSKIAAENQHKKADEQLHIPMFEYDVVVQGQPRKKTEPDIVAIFKELIVERLDQLGLSEKFNGEDDLRVHFRSFGGVIPWVYRDNLTFGEFSRFAEYNLGLPGVTVAERGSRVYPYGALACHILGYVRLPDDQRVSEEERKGWDYYVPDDFGGEGVEKSFDSHLRGKPGVRTMEKDERGRLAGEVAYEAPRKGNDVYLTLDARIQVIAEKALREGNIGRGSVVVVDPNNGEVLAMASVPSYDPNKFIPRVNEADWVQLLNNKTNPLLNRAIRGYVPGSTYKVPIALAGCMAHVQGQRFNCSGGVTYGNNYMKCWIAEKGSSHGTLDLSDALMRSCNCFFYQFGNAARIDNITKIGKLLALGERTGIELEGESGGILPNPAWLQAHRPQERWSNGHTANTSIGQGSVEASPLQMASVTAAVASGKAFKPHLLKKVLDGSQVVIEPPPVLRTDLTKYFPDKDLELVRKGMWKVVNGDAGTAKAARIPGVEVAGKTGTAQNWRIDEKAGRVQDNHTLFISFAPYEKAEFAVCILVQGGKSGGGCAAPVAHRVLEQALALKNGHVVLPEVMAEAQGNFNKIEAVTYPDLALPVVAAVDDDGDVGVQAPEREAADESPRARTNSAPSIRKKADRAGSAGVGSNRPVPKATPVRRAPMFNRGGPPDQNQQPASGGFFRRLFPNLPNR